jgi:hypothetical protein
VIGWAAATGAIGLEPLILFLIVFLWTPPHFWALSLTRTDDYARAGVPMLPVVRGAPQQRQILPTACFWSRRPCSLVLGLRGRSGATAVVSGTVFIALAARLSRSRGADRRARIACSSSPFPISSCCLRPSWPTTRSIAGPRRSQRVALGLTWPAHAERLTSPVRAICGSTISPQGGLTCASISASAP